MITLLIIFVGCLSTQPLLTSRVLAYINSIPKYWTAGISQKFKNLTRDDMEAMTMSPWIGQLDRASLYRFVRHAERSATYNYPESFDFREEYPQCLLPTYDQGHCGSCWAFASTRAFGDTRCMQGIDSVPVLYSPQYLVSCSLENMGCTGGTMEDTGIFLRDTGAVTEDCVPYVDGDAHWEPCVASCVDGSPIETVKLKDFVRYDGNLEAMMEAISTNGPIHASMMLYEDFLYYQSGIYHFVYGTTGGMHAIEIVGYGTETSKSDETGEEIRVDFWIVRNSWGEEWGENGFFRILRGTNECKIEDHSQGFYFDPSK